MLSVFRKENTGDEYSGYLLWILIAVELFMSFSFLGYVHIKPISITFVYIPVLIAGCILGAKESALVGAVFGLASMWKASAFYVGAGDAVFSPVMSGKPVESIILSVGMRTMFGLLIGLLYQRARKFRYPLVSIILVTSLGRTLHTFLVYLCMQIFFPEAGFTAADTLEDIMRWDYIPFLLAADTIVVFCYIFVRSKYVKDLFRRIRTVDQVNSVVSHYRPGLTVMLVLVLLASVSVAVYFTNRIQTVMSEYGVNLDEEISYDLMHLQIQFLLGMIALALIVIIVITLYQKNFNYLYYEARLDGLTGLSGRQQFFQSGENLLKNMKNSHSENIGSFFILDIDEFKRINDIYGHPAGDNVLKEVADKLKKIFGGKGIIGRLGGDEFVALVNQPLEKVEIETLLNELKESINNICVKNEKITCSIGVIPVEKSYTIEELYKYADRLLYEAKKKGKDQFVFGYRFED